MIRKEVSGENGGEMLSQGLLPISDELSLPTLTIFAYSINLNYLNLFVQKIFFLFTLYVWA